MLYSALILGFLGSFHCIGMCGPIAFMLPIDKKNKWKGIFQTLSYHIGRFTAYSIIGLLFGAIGKGLYLAGFQQRLTILIGVIMIIIAVTPVKIFNKYNFSKPIYFLISKVKERLGFYLQKRSAKKIFLIGFFNGFLPCGLVYGAVFGSISMGSTLEGALYMLLFGLGTLPLMTTAIYVGNFVKVSLRNKIQKSIPIFVAIVGLLFILRGLGLGIDYISPSDAQLNISNNSNTCVIVEDASNNNGR
ncbi:sulfite exporter TauE/SafE family protein [Aureivirga marina]|uniref:sulfite exporter TauE/SafE family protein n=1 Tax=Aureivirga marina TaxID=1182451 RepID=UPI0018CA929F|nr:sulfite exporter TauE/SafE family protein [Aureivirga marina]